MYPNALPSDVVSLLDSLDPVSQAPGTVTTGWVSAVVAHRFFVVINTGVLGSGATIDAKLQQATDSSGTGAKDIAGKAITQLVKATHDNKQAFISLRPEEMDINANFSHFRLSITVGSAASQICANVYGLVARTSPASRWNNADVVQLVG